MSKGLARLDNPGASSTDSSEESKVHIHSSTTDSREDGGGRDISRLAGFYYKINRAFGVIDNILITASTLGLLSVSFTTDKRELPQGKAQQFNVKRSTANPLTVDEATWIVTQKILEERLSGAVEVDVDAPYYGLISDKDMALIEENAASLMTKVNTENKEIDLRREILTPGPIAKLMQDTKDRLMGKRKQSAAAEEDKSDRPISGIPGSVLSAAAERRSEAPIAQPSPRLQPTQATNPGAVNTTQTL